MYDEKENIHNPWVHSITYSSYFCRSCSITSGIFVSMDLRITYMFYGLYVWLLFRFLLVIPVFQHMQGASSNGSIIRAIIYMLMAIVFFMIEITGDKVDVYTFLRGFVVTGSMDVCCENIYLLVKGKRK